MTETPKRKPPARRKPPAPPGSFCTACGAGLETDWRFCPHCGRNRTFMAKGPPSTPPPINKKKRYIAFSLAGVGLIALIVVIVVIASTVDDAYFLPNSDYDDWCDATEVYVRGASRDLPPTFFKLDLIGYADSVKDPESREAFAQASTDIVNAVPDEDEDLYEAEVDRHEIVHKERPGERSPSRRKHALGEPLNVIRDRIDYRCSSDPYD